MLKEIRIHGRGGQGVVTLSELIASSAYNNKKKVQAFPSFGVERRGAPIESYVRVSDKDIFRMDQIASPTHLIIVDDTLLEIKNIFRGLENCKLVLINSQKGSLTLKKYFSNYKNIKIVAIDAVSLALEILGKPIVNTAILGAFCVESKLFSQESLEKVIAETFADKGEDIVNKNIKLAGETIARLNSK